VAAATVVKEKADALLLDAGRLFALAADTVIRLPRRPWQFRVTGEQTWFIASVTLFPALLLTLSFGLVVGLQVYNLTRQFGAESAQGAATSPSRSARVESPARSDPAPGSLKSWHQNSSPASSGRR
jgi:phospholipid/cholesterol/gamma-HCH transport system permease protein